MAWNASKPDGGDYLADSDADLRANFAALQSAIGQDHDFDASTQTGKHEKMTLVETADLGTGAEGVPILGAQTASGKAELVFTDEDDNDIQLTSGGSINGAALKADSVDSDAYAAGSIDNEHLADDAVDSDEIADGAVDAAHLSADCVDGTKIADDAVDSEHIASGAVDADHLSSGAQTAGFTPTSYSGGESVTLPNGMIMKFGKSSTGQPAIVTFGTAFPNAIISVNATCNASGAAGNWQTKVYDVSTSGFRAKTNASYQFYWLAIGY